MATAQEHLQPLSALDRAFLFQESPTRHMHIGAVAIFEGPAPSFAELREHLRARLDRVPRYRQKLAEPPGAVGRLLWIDDPTFNIDYHLRHNAIPSPGDESALRRLVGRIYSQRLDRNKPLWEMLLVEGLEGDRFALITKTHHAVVDGIRGVDILTALFDAEREPVTEAPPSAWVPRPEPSAAELAAASATEATRELVELPVRALGALTDPARLRRVAERVGGEALSLVRPAPPSPLNAKIGPHRRVAFADAQLEDLRLVKQAFGGTVNDVVLAVVAGALRAWMHQRGLRTEGVELRAAVPVSTRSGEEQEGALGNRITQLVVPLPVDIGDPVARLRLVQEAMGRLTASREALGAKVIAGTQDFAPPTILAQSARVSFSARAYNLIVTNVPGPQVPLYLLGRELERIYPLGYLSADRALAVAAMSYHGRVGFGLVADYDLLADLEAVAEGIEDSLAELVALAGRRERRRATAPAKDARPKARAKPKPRPKPKPKPKPKATTKPKAGPKAKPKAGPKAGPKAAAKPKPGTTKGEPR